MFRKKYLTTIAKNRKYLNQLINDFRKAQAEDKKPDVDEYRCLTHMLRIMLRHFEVEKNIEIDELLHDIEEQIGKMQICGILGN